MARGDDLIRHFASASGRPGSMREHQERRDAILAEVKRQRLLSRRQTMESGHLAGISWHHALGQWAAAVTPPRGPMEDRWVNGDDSMEYRMPLGPVDSDVPRRLAEGYRSPEFLDYVRRSSGPLATDDDPWGQRRSHEDDW